MSQLSVAISTALAQGYRDWASDLHKWVDALTDDQFWRNPFPFGNSIGHLLLHLIGNLSYYIGAQVARTGYIRNRDLEFTEAHRPTKSEVLRNFDAAIAMVIAAIEQQSEADWTAVYTAEREPEARDRFTIFLRCASHLYHHVGQINYLSRELTRN
jgi:uncharacterized damage-inducible protein DinB